MKVRKFASAEDQALTYQVLYVWWPPVSKTQANPNGDFLVLKQNPAKHVDTDSTDVIMHEIVHAVSARQELQKKLSATQEFLAICPAHEHLKKLEILEEPLAVALGQMLYTERFSPKSYVYARKWYNNPWNSMFGKLIYPVAKEYFDKGAMFDDRFIKQTAFLCSEVLKTAKKLKVN